MILVEGKIYIPQCVCVFHCVSSSRYHSYPWVTAAHPAQLLHNTFLVDNSWAHCIYVYVCAITQGDDARRITQEIVSADDYFQRASQYL